MLPKALWLRRAAAASIAFAASLRHDRTRHGRIEAQGERETMSGGDVLITGGAGFIGSHVALRFAREGFAIRVLDDLSTGDAGNLAPAWRLVRADVADRDAVDAAVAGTEIVIHLAAFTSVPESFERFGDCYRTNVFGTTNVVRACVRHGVRKLVFASSSAVYSDQASAPKSEAECPAPTSPYGISKLEGEHLLASHTELDGLGAVALRFFNVYGPRQAAGSAYAAAVPIFIERALQGEPLTIYGDGRQTRDFVFVADVAEAVLRAAQGPESGVFNVGTGEAQAILDLADEIAGLTGHALPHHFAAKRTGDVRASSADVSRARQALGWSPANRLAQGLAETLAWYRARRSAH
jgi:UDP-glucose 4-epimerase